MALKYTFSYSTLRHNVVVWHKVSREYIHSLLQCRTLKLSEISSTGTHCPFISLHHGVITSNIITCTIFRFRHIFFFLYSTWWHCQQFSQYSYWPNGLDDRGIGFRFLSESRDFFFSFPLNLQIGSEAHPTCYVKDSGASFPRNKAAWEWSSQFSI
jgi:hypothetical protein